MEPRTKNAELRLLRRNQLTDLENAKRESAFLPDGKNTFPKSVAIRLRRIIILPYLSTGRNSQFELNCRILSVESALSKL